MSAPAAFPSLREREAIKAHERGWLVTPLDGKKPIHTGWTEAPAPSLSEVQGWARKGNVGIRCGAASGIVVIDCDPGADIAALDLPPTWTVVTGRDGRHFYFKIPAGISVKNSVQKIADHVDVRSTGGQVVAVGSLHPDTARLYRWQAGASPDDLPLADLPDHILAKLCPPLPAPRPRTITVPTNGSTSSYGRAALEAEVERVRTAPQGSRNDTANRAAFNLGQLVAGGVLDRATVEADLEGAALAAGLSEVEARATIRSGMTAGMAEPRQAPERQSAPRTREADRPEDFGMPEPEDLGTAVPSPPAAITSTDRQADDPPVESWPAPAAAAAYHGILGEIVGIIEPHTEGDPVGILAQLIVGLGSMIGGGPYYRVEGTRHHVNENVVLVGRTAGGRKGTAWDQARRPLAAVDPDWADQRIQGGLSSGEGLIFAVRDARSERQAVKEKGRVAEYQTVEVDAGVEDKRLLIYEPELARVLKVMLREGSTLSTIVRQAWDSPDLRVMTKTPAVATGAHVSIVAHITSEELLRQLQDTEAASGFGNRFLWLAVKRARLLPDGGDLDAAQLDPLVRRLSIAVSEARRTGEMTRDPEARDLWHEKYPQLSSGKPGLLGAMLSRAEAHVLRLSMMYALGDASNIIRRPHLQAALALWDYAARSAAFVFGSSLGDPTADDLLRTLRAAEPDGMTRTEISKHFGRNKSAAEITRALTVLAHQGLAHASTDKPDGPGRPTETWHTAKGYELNERGEG